MVLSSAAMRNQFLAVTVVMLAMVVLLRNQHLGPHPGRTEAADAGALEKAGRAVVRTAVADLLTQPVPGSSLADQALLGDTVSVLRRSSGTTVEVETTAHYRGHVQAVDLHPLAPGTPPYAESGPIIAVASRFANVYEQPDVTLRNPQLLAPLGARLRLLAEQDARWLKVVLPDGRQAFVQRGDITREQGRFDAHCITEHALRHEGTPYLWGGRSTYGVDCSGLVSNAYAACGVIPPRDADQQFDWHDMVPVDSPSLQAGDLIFFGAPTKNGEPRKVTHVGIYLGNGHFVHATTAERPTVHTSNLPDPRWQEELVGMRHHPLLRH